VVLEVDGVVVIIPKSADSADSAVFASIEFSALGFIVTTCNDIDVEVFVVVVVEVVDVVVDFVVVCVGDDVESMSVVVSCFTFRFSGDTVPKAMWSNKPKVDTGLAGFEIIEAGGLWKFCSKVASLTRL